MIEQPVLPNNEKLLYYTYDTPDHTRAKTTTNRQTDPPYQATNTTVKHLPFPLFKLTHTHTHFAFVSILRISTSSSSTVGNR